jgi:hypothetical protein
MAARNSRGTRDTFVKKAERVTRNLEALDKILVAAHAVLKRGVVLAALILVIIFMIVRSVSGPFDPDPLSAVGHLVTQLGNLAG